MNGLEESSRKEGKSPPLESSGTKDSADSQNETKGDGNSIETDALKQPDLKTRKSPSQKVSGIELLTESGSFGKTKILIAGGKSRTDNGIVQVIHQPPYDQVYFLNPESGTYYSWDTSQSYPFTSALPHKDLKCDRFKENGSKKHLGHECVELLAYRGRSETPAARYLLTKEFKAPPSLALGYAFNYFYPPEYGIPMHITIRRGARTWESLLKVEKIEKKEFDSSLFEVPSGYKPVKDRAEFLIFTPGDDDIEKMFEYHFKD